MRTNIPAPVVAVILVAVALVLGYVFWRGSSPGADAEKTEAMLRKAFGGRGPGVTLPPAPGAAKSPEVSGPAAPKP